MDISWLRDESLGSGEDLPEPGMMATEIMEKLRVAMEEMEALMVLLEGEDVEQEELWILIKTALPGLLEQLEALLPSLPDE